MFATKGWSVSTDKLKIEIDNGKEVVATDRPAPAKNRKRKRASNSQNPEVITASNLSTMWEKVIEQKDPRQPSQKQANKENKASKKKERQKQEGSSNAQPDAKISSKKDAPQQKHSSKKSEKNQGKKVTDGAPDQTAAEESLIEDEEWGGFDDEPGTQISGATASVDREDDDGPRKKKKQKQAEKELRKERKFDSKSTTDKSPAPAPAPPAPAPQTAVKLTPLQASMREKLVSARFRHLNETLYTRPSTEAFQLFQESPEMFSEYHEGFRRQVDVWPENPVNGYISDIEARAKVRFPPKGVRHDFANPISSIRLLPLPRDNRSGICTIADLGCGDAALSTKLQPKLRKLHLDIRSYDLQTGGSPLITRADIANLPLANGSVDVAIFCLALMGTNWVDFIEEAYRVLRWKGELWVAEIKSRFTNPGAKKNKVVAHSVGNRKNPAVAGKKTKKDRENAEAAAEADEAELAVEVDGAELRQQETDITAFVDALRARGFLLHKELGGGAVDMTNKMFVKMHFVKAAPATRGKCASEVKDNVDRMGAHGPAKKKKFLTDDEETARDETAILKPCVYKLR
ncbi:methyltransferase-domain-containing protein [Echria macrotheca]|uniref:Ribosomal RNA-processing protein 8 n=1 Tax=Echria macrotheca TaxID=438768 RepID=A0AAJ0BFA8_9PEZI|nr:methyltransferase-domain-containing protein [Echria macrotheca]